MLNKKLFIIALLLGSYCTNGYTMGNVDLKHSRESGLVQEQEKQKIEFDTIINLINSQHDPLTDAQIEDIKNKLGIDVTRKIFRHIIHRNEMLAYAYRESLLAAITRLTPDSISRCRLKCIAHYTAFRNQNVPTPDNKRIVLSVAKENSIVADLNPINRLKDCTPDYLLGQSLLKSEFAVVGWSDGKTQIIINESDKRNLNNLSEKQILFIDSLHNRSSHRLSYKESRIFSSLPGSMQSYLKSNYQSLCCPWWTNPAVPIIAGMTVLGLIAMGKENRQLLGGAMSNGPGSSKAFVYNSFSWTWDWTKYLVATPIKFGLTYTVGIGLSLLSKAANKASSWTTWDIG